MIEREFVEEVMFLSDQVYWLRTADSKKQKLEFIRQITRQAEYIAERLEETEKDT